MSRVLITKDTDDDTTIIEQATNLLITQANAVFRVLTRACFLFFASKTSFEFRVTVSL